MLPSVKKTDSAKTKVLSKREEKKRINIRWNSSVVFQLGILASLGLAFLLLESDISLGKIEPYSPGKEYVIDEPPMLAWTLEKPEIKVIVKPKPLQKVVEPVKQKSFTEVEVVDNFAKIVETHVTPTDAVINTPTVVSKPIPASTGPRNMNQVEFSPIFPGCESLSNNEERKACMSRKMNQFITKKFNVGKFSHLEAGKTHTVNVQFTIGKDGFVKDIKARAVIDGLVTEAKNVVAKMPQMEPGKQGDISVDVLYRMPIKFQVE